MNSNAVIKVERLCDRVAITEVGVFAAMTVIGVMILAKTFRWE